MQDKEETISISYKDYSPSVMKALMQGSSDKVRNFLTNIAKDIKEFKAQNTTKKPFEYRILMKELTSVSPAHPGLRRHNRLRVREARHIPGVPHRAHHLLRTQE
jgi:hypothetical protein